MTSKSLLHNLFYRQHFLRAVSIVVLVMGLQLLLLHPVYETHDDVYMTGIVTGILGSGEPSSLIMFSNVLIGWFLKQFYLVAPHWPWYGIYLVAIHFLSHVGFLWAIFAATPGKLSACLGMLYLAIIGTHFFHHLSFTTTAYLATQSGIFLLVIPRRDSFPTLSMRWPAWLAAVFMLTVASMIRMEMFLLISGLSIPFVITNFLSREYSKILRQGFIVTTTLAAVLIVLMWFINWNVYSSDSEWKSYWSFHRHIAQVADNAPIEQLSLNPDATRKILESAGWTENDFLLMKSWYFSDEEVFSQDRIRSVATGWNHLRIQSMARSVTTLIRLVITLFGNPICSTCLLLSLFLPNQTQHTAFIRCSRFTWLLCWCGMGYLILTQKLPARVYEPIIIFGITVQAINAFVPIFHINVAATHQSPWNRLRLCGLAIISILGLYSSARDYQFAQQCKTIGQEFWSDVDRLASLNAPVIIVWHPFPLDCISPFDDIQPLSRLKLYSFGAFSRTPLAHSLKKRCQISEVLELLQGTAPAWIASSPDNNRRMERYLFEHYNRRIELKPRFRGGSGFLLYTVHRTSVPH